MPACPMASTSPRNTLAFRCLLSVVCCCCVEREKERERDEQREREMRKEKVESRQEEGHAFILDHACVGARIHTCVCGSVCVCVCVCERDLSRGLSSSAACLQCSNAFSTEAKLHSETKD